MGDRCAVLARTLDEPLAGTAPVAPRWAVLEHRAAWPRDVNAHTDPTISAFLARATAAGFRPLLVRRPGRRRGGDDGPVRLLLADTTPGRSALTSTTVDDLAGITLPPAGAALPGAPVTDPVLLVCTHGRRDLCCAVDGRALVADLDQEPDVWECSHLGGHRFAPTALVLPTGYLYGRLDAVTAVAVRGAAAAGEVDTALCRGRSTWPPEGQVAELAVRAASGLRDADALTVDGTTVSARDGRAWEVDVEEVPGAVRPASCGADAVGSRALHVTAVRPLLRVGPG
jgi:hypothetical protein